ncbi:response regulator [Chloroflexia bacterium SDU3-3]|nr:response regulator [Chloroflexia bacterium SDU3-3]
MNQTLTILIVDDEPAGRETLAALLHAERYQLEFADCGKHAIAQARDHQPDLILLDVMMPEMDGFEVCRYLRATPSLAEVPIILITALDDRDSRLEGIEAGADDFITKPFDRIELRARIRAILRLNRYRRLLHQRARFERVIELAPNGMLILSSEGMVNLANPAIYRLLGIADSTIIGQPFARFIASPYAAQFSYELQNVISTPATVARFESELICPSGEKIDIEIDIGHIDWENAPAAQVNLRDITERKRAEAMRQRQMEHLSALRLIDKAIASNLELAATLNIVIDQAITHLGVQAAAILLRRPHTQSFEYSTLRGFSRGALGASVLRIGEGFAGQVALARRALSLADMPPTIEPPINAGIADYRGIPLIVKGQVEGILEIFSRTPILADTSWWEFLETLASQVAVAIDHAALFESIQHANLELTMAYDSTLEGWARALELRDKETEGHAQRVTDMTLALARAMGLPTNDLVHIRRGALLHDIGKMGIPDSILLKAGPLSDDEWQIMRQHPVYAYNMLSPIAYLRPALDIPYYHHEKWDGTGYPRGLKGEAIPLAARIFAIADVWDALSFDRPYRSAWPEAQVREHIQAAAGSHFDPQVVEAFLRLHAIDTTEQRLSILIVDDEEHIATTAHRLLNDQFIVFSTTSPDEALDILAREPIAIILSDQRMPQMTGVQLLERARHLRPTTLGILSSAYFDNDALTEAINLGNVRGYIQKPWNAIELRRRVNEVAQIYRAMP